MASGSKERNVFTEDPADEGKPGKTDSLERTGGADVGGGGTILSAFPQDNVHGVELPDTRGERMGGGIANLSHSLTGASAVQRSKGKPENSGI